MSMSENLYCTCETFTLNRTDAEQQTRSLTGMFYYEAVRPSSDAILFRHMPYPFKLGLRIWRDTERTTVTAVNHGITAVCWILLYNERNAAVNS